MDVKRRNVYKKSDRYTYDYNIDILDERWINKSLISVITSIFYKV